MYRSRWMALFLAILSAAFASGAFPLAKPMSPFLLPTTTTALCLRVRPRLPVILDTILLSTTMVSNFSKVSSPTGSGGPMLRPGALVPDHPRSSGVSLRGRKPCISLRSCSSFSSRCLSGGSSTLSTTSFPRTTGAFRPGQTMFTLPTPITCPLFRSLDSFREWPDARPRFLPALLTLVTPFHSCSAVSFTKKLVPRMHSTAFVGSSGRSRTPDAFACVRQVADLQ
uniref:Putative secreted protein n=1 Tax=Ixodes ricinus TaxID=34613 RepID=A0A6B0V370_IXORI